ncbi:MAG: LysR family transcriptional regulator [Gammaproteobacteria bacterium]|nr:LysR family transcriptional regulator [Gammaproteobacteria bacterium]
MNSNRSKGLNRLDIKQLQVLQGLLQERNLSRVAAKMGLTQQAISEQLRKLRDLFDDPLFVRQSNGVIPTALAESLGVKITPILRDIEALLEKSSFEPKDQTGTFKISASDYAMAVILPPLLAKFRLLAPNLKIIISEFESDNLHALMAAGEIDLALTFPDFIPSDMPSTFLFEEHHVCVASRHSPLLNQPLSLADIAPLPQLVISLSRYNLQGSADAWFAQEGLTRNIVMSIPSFSAASDIIESTDIVAFLPSRLLPNNKVKILQLDFTPPSFELVAAWHKRSNTSQLHQWILSLLQQTTNV